MHIHSCKYLGHAVLQMSAPKGSISSYIVTLTTTSVLYPNLQSLTLVHLFFLYYSDIKAMCLEDNGRIKFLMVIFVKCGDILKNQYCHHINLLIVLVDFIVYQ